MLAYGFFRWWYFVGWADCAKKILQKLRDLVDFFSFKLILRTLFAPFRQISAGEVDNAAMDVRLQAFFDRLFSRCIGFVVRVGILVFGIIAFIVEVVVGFALLAVWPALPLSPVLCVLLTLAGVNL